MQEKAIVGVIGLGYVGLPLVLRFCEEGFRVMGFDVDSEKVTKLRHGKSYLKSIPSSRISPFIQQNFLKVTDDFSLLSRPDCILICVPTPLTEKMEPDLQYIEKTTEAIRNRLREGTTDRPREHHLSRNDGGIPPSPFGIDWIKGRERLLPRLLAGERRSRQQTFSTAQVPKVVSGVTPSCPRCGWNPLPAGDPERWCRFLLRVTAELTKLLENIYRSINIALVNELKCWLTEWESISGK